MSPRLLAATLLIATGVFAAEPEKVTPDDLVAWLQLRAEAAEIERDFSQNEATIKTYLEAMRQRHPLAAKQSELLDRFEQLRNRQNAMRDELTKKYAADGYTMKPDGAWEKIVAESTPPDPPKKE